MVQGILEYYRESTNSRYYHICRCVMRDQAKMLETCCPGKYWAFVRMWGYSKDNVNEICLQLLNEPWPVEIPSDWKT